MSEKETLCPDSRNLYGERKDKIKFTCPNVACKLNAWAKASAKLTCGHCGLPMVSELTGINNPEPQASGGGANLPAVSMQCSSGNSRRCSHSKTTSTTRKGDS